MSMTIENLHFSYGTREVLKDISFSAKPGEFLSVLGPNGVGKSTLFRCMLGLLKPDSGKIFIDGTSIQTLNHSELARKIAYIPQSHNPVFNYSVLDMVLMGTTAQLGRFESPKNRHISLAAEALERLGISSMKNRGYASLSGGERQLVLIARAIAQQAKILIMDEPSANLDFGNRIRVMQMIKDLTIDGYTVIQSTHDPDQAYLYSDRILAMHEGKVLAFGTPAETITAPMISTLYGVEAEVVCMHSDRIRICVKGGIFS